MESRISTPPASILHPMTSSVVVPFPRAAKAFAIATPNRPVAPTTSTVLPRCRLTGHHYNANARAIFPRTSGRAHAGRKFGRSSARTGHGVVNHLA